jgi:hypothetical protein
VHLSEFSLSWALSAATPCKSNNTTSSAGQGDLPTAAKWLNLVWEFSQVINLGSILVGNATLVVANVLTCNKHSQYYPRACDRHVAVPLAVAHRGAVPVTLAPCLLGTIRGGAIHELQ